MNQLGKERLLKLAQHLETGVLGHKIFDFSVLMPKKGLNGNYDYDF